MIGPVYLFSARHTFFERTVDIKKQLTRSQKSRSETDSNKINGYNDLESESCTASSFG